MLVSNKGPSCTNIAQIAHRKDKVGICATIKFWAIHLIYTSRDFLRVSNTFNFLSGWHNEISEGVVKLSEVSFLRGKG